jgi:hypothetical protein
MNDQLQKILEKSLHALAEQRNYENYTLDISPVTTEGANYTSQLYQGKILASNNQELLFFSKVATLTEDIRSQMPTKIYFIEQYTYRKLKVIFEKIEEQYKIPTENRLRIPELYWYDDKNLEEVLVIENLSEQGYTTYSRFESLTWEYASKSVEELGKFHALSIAMAKYYPEDYKEVQELVAISDTGMNKYIVEQMMSKGLEVIKDENRERIKSCIDKDLPRIMSLVYGSVKRPALAHGDFRMSNIMHKISKVIIAIYFYIYFIYLFIIYSLTYQYI